MVVVGCGLKFKRDNTAYVAGSVLMRGDQRWVLLSVPSNHRYELAIVKESDFARNPDSPVSQEAVEIVLLANVTVASGGWPLTPSWTALALERWVQQRRHGQSSVETWSLDRVAAIGATKSGEKTPTVPSAASTPSRGAVVPEGWILVERGKYEAMEVELEQCRQEAHQGKQVPKGVMISDKTWKQLNVDMGQLNDGVQELGTRVATLETLLKECGATLSALQRDVGVLPKQLEVHLSARQPMVAQTNQYASGMIASSSMAPMAFPVMPQLLQSAPPPPAWSVPHGVGCCCPSCTCLRHHGSGCTCTGARLK